MSSGSRERARGACDACMARIDGQALRCRWCGAAIPTRCTTAAALARTSLSPSSSQDFRQWEESRSAIETTVDPSSSQDSAVVHAIGGQPSESPSRTIGMPSSTK